MIKSTSNLIDEFFKQEEMEPMKLDILWATERIINCFRSGHKLLICGNGGSASDSLHIVGELMKRFKIRRPLSEEVKKNIVKSYPDEAYFLNGNLESALPAISLVGETSLMTAISNDINPDLIFAQQLIGYGNKGDILLVLSTSGNSNNIVYACKIAKILKMAVIGLSGKDGGGMKLYCDNIILAPSDKTDIIQEYHLKIYHFICAIIENEIFGGKE